MKEVGIINMAMVSIKLVKALGFSKGWAELIPKKPPPFSPSSLMISKCATGPLAMIWVAPSKVVAMAGGG